MTAVRGNHYHTDRTSARLTVANYMLTKDLQILGHDDDSIRSWPRVKNWKFFAHACKFEGRLEHYSYRGQDICPGVQLGMNEDADGRQPGERAC
jgi:hypothetical protein